MVSLGIPNIRGKESRGWTQAPPTEEPTPAHYTTSAAACGLPLFNTRSGRPSAVCAHRTPDRNRPAKRDSPQEETKKRRARSKCIPPCERLSYSSEGSQLAEFLDQLCYQRILCANKKTLLDTTVTKDDILAAVVAEHTHPSFTLDPTSPDRHEQHLRAFRRKRSRHLHGNKRNDSFFLAPARPTAPAATGPFPR